MSKQLSSEIEPLLKINEVADICRVSTKTVRRWIEKAELAVIRLGHLLRIERKELARFMHERRSI